MGMENTDTANEIVTVKVNWATHGRKKWSYMAIEAMKEAGATYDDDTKTWTMTAEAYNTLGRHKDELELVSGQDALNALVGRREAAAAATRDVPLDQISPGDVIERHGEWLEVAAVKQMTPNWWRYTATSGKVLDVRKGERPAGLRVRT